jgi:hypothetical protein
VRGLDSLALSHPLLSQTEQPASIEEIQQRAAQMRQDKAAASAKGGLVEVRPRVCWKGGMPMCL